METIKAKTNDWNKALEIADLVNTPLPIHKFEKPEKMIVKILRANEIFSSEYQSWCLALTVEMKVSYNEFKKETIFSNNVLSSRFLRHLNIPYDNEREHRYDFSAIGFNKHVGQDFETIKSLSGYFFIIEYFGLQKAVNSENLFKNFSIIQL